MNESNNSISSINEENSEYPVLVLLQQPDSHTFNERKIVLSDTIKVGRSVARARPSDINGIFDCKVLSRNHAIIWYEGGKVWLRDTKSSNGTYVNNQLLSKGTEESPPREIYSGDIIQFGVEVVENTTTHGCIIAHISIFLPDGSELRRQPDMIGGMTNGLGSSPGGIPMSNYYEEQIYQLAQYIQEASHREQTLEKKLQSLSQLIVDTQEASDSSWRVILNQDRLLEKLQMLQDQVEMYAVNEGDENEEEDEEVASGAREDNDDGEGVVACKSTISRSRMIRLVKQKYDIERQSKVLLESLANEKCEVLQRVIDLEQRLNASQDECSQLRMALESIQLEHEESGRMAAEQRREDTEVAQKHLKEIQLESAEQRKELEQAKINLEIQLDDLKCKLKEAKQKIISTEEKSKEDIEKAQRELDQLKENQNRSDISKAAGSISGEMEKIYSDIKGEVKDLDVEEQLLEEVGKLDNILEEVSANTMDNRDDNGIGQILHVSSTQHNKPQSTRSMQTQEDELMRLTQQLSTAKEELQEEKDKADSLKIELLNIQDDNKLIQSKFEFLESTNKELTRKLSELQIITEDTKSCQKCLEYIKSNEVSKKSDATNDESCTVTELRRECEELREKVTRIESDLEEERKRGSGGDLDDRDKLIEKLKLELEEYKAQLESSPTEIVRQQILTRARRISGLSMIPLIILVTGIIFAIISVISRPIISSK